MKSAMSGCLACKACSSQCPIKIDVPGFRARFLQLYHSRYLRPVRDYLVAGVERYAPLMALAPATFNFFLKWPVVRTLSERALGMVDVPLLSQPPLRRQAADIFNAQPTLEALEHMSVEQRQTHVLIVQDPFTSHYDARVVADFARLVVKLWLTPVLLPFSPNGKAQHIKGFLQRFARTARRTADFLNRTARLELPMVGVDPALVPCYREVLGATRGDFQVQLVHEWLAGLPESDHAPSRVHAPEPAVQAAPWYLFGHCTEATQLPASARQWRDIFARYGARLETVSVGCCGMAGTYGHESANYAHSRGIYALSWQQQLAQLPRGRCLAIGYSCRSQVKRIEGEGLRHPLQALLEIIA